MNKIIYFFKNHFIRVSIGFILIIFSLAATVISTALSCIGLLQLLNKLEITIPNTEVFVLSFVIILQIIVFFGSIAKGIVFHQSPQHYTFIIWFTNGAFLLSILSTVTFFYQFDKSVRMETMSSIFNIIPLLPQNLKDWFVLVSTDFTLIYLGAILLDVMSMHFPGIGFDLIFKISTKKKLEIEDMGYIKKCFKLITYFPKKWIDEKCIEFGIIKDKNPKEVKDIFKDEVKDIFKDEVKDIFKDEVKDTIKCPKISLTKKEYPKEVKDKVKDKNPKEVKDIFKDINPKLVKKSPKIIDMRFIEVARYILDEYKENELITWEKVKDFSKIYDEYNLKKLRKYLKDKDIIKTIGKKSYRNNCPKDILKNLKMS